MGYIITKNELQIITSFFDGIIVIDEAYIEYSGMDNSLIESAKNNNIVILRSFSKAWGLAGIRIGYNQSIGIYPNRESVIVIKYKREL